MNSAFSETRQFEDTWANMKAWINELLGKHYDSYL